MSQLRAPRHRSFQNGDGDTEHFLSIAAPSGLEFRSQLRWLESIYAEQCQQWALDPDSAVFRRIFVSDVLNQAALVRDSRLVDDQTAVSILQQQPLPDRKLEMLSYHVASAQPLEKQRLSPRHLLIRKNGRRHLWSTRLCSCDSDKALSSERQTEEIFADLIGILAQQGANLRDHCVRTWIYMKDVDVFYKGMVDARRTLFRNEGLTAATHYIASTGIEGSCSHRYDIVAMDAYSNLDLRPGQISFLNDFNKLCPTQDYNVTFERGTTLSYGDRAHHYISGTASIDHQGDVVHRGDVGKQLDRTLDNIEALLRSGQSTLDDMMYWIVYLRDPADYERVESRLREQFPTVPMAIVKGAVCRPEWLIEAEGVAIRAHNDPTLPTF